MKNLIIYFIAMVAMMSSCKKDQSNYDYKDHEKITVTGIESSYTLISELESLNLKPEVTSTDPNANFEYLWGIYETNVQGSVPVLDTLAKTKNLNYLIKQAAKGWVLVYRVTNKNTGYSQYINVPVNVVTEFTRGWYVAKDDGTDTDLDLFLTPTSIVPTGKRENVYSSINGSKLPGQANLLSFLTGYKSTVTGVLGNTRTLALSTDKDMATVNVNTLKKIYTLDNIMFDTPPVKGPCYTFLGSGAYYLINGGNIHSIVNNSPNIGKFGGRFLRDASNNPYQLSKYFMSNNSGNAYLYDETSSSFFAIGSGYGTALSSISDVTGTAMSATNTNQKVLFMGIKSATYLPSPALRYTFAGCAVFQDKTNPSNKTVSHVEMDLFTMKFTNTSLTSADKLYSAAHITMPFGQENILYFSIGGNQVWSRNLSNNFEKLEYTVPAGEEITFIRHKNGTEVNYAYNYIMVGSKINGTYKIRMFNKSSGSITGNPIVTLEGTGAAKDVLYISPSVSEFTHNIQW